MLSAEIGPAAVLESRGSALTDDMASRGDVLYLADFSRIEHTVGKGLGGERHQTWRFSTFALIPTVIIRSKIISSD